MKKRKWGGASMRAALATALSAVLVLTAAPAVALAEGNAGADPGSAANVTHTLSVGEIENFVAKDKEEIKCGTNDYFTLISSKNMKLDKAKQSKEFSDGKKLTDRLSFGSGSDGKKDAVKFKTSKTALVEVHWVSNKKDRSLVLLNKSRKEEKRVTASEDNQLFVTKWLLNTAGEYYITNAGGGNYLFRVDVTEGNISRGAWSEVADPKITSVALDPDDSSKIVVNATGACGLDAADRLTVTMRDAHNTVVATADSSKDGNEQAVTFSPASSGSYKFSAALSRDGEKEVKNAAETKSLAFILPLTAPEFKNATNKGNGSVTFKFFSVKEADSYEFSIPADTDGAFKGFTQTFKPASGSDSNTETEYVVTVPGLTIGKSYTASVLAKRKRGETIDSSETGTFIVTAKTEAEQEWTFTCMGPNATKNHENAWYSGSIADGSVTVWDLESSGKLQPKAADGLSFYYTAIPADKNFTLTAKATIDSWKYTNAQEGFGLMAADRVTYNGNNSAFWNNAYLLGGNKVEYYYDTETGKVTDDSNKQKVTMKLGLGAQEKTGVTKENLETISAVSQSMTTLETSCAAKATAGSTEFNIFDNATNKSSMKPQAADKLLTSVKLQIRKSNTGYLLRYLPDGQTEWAEKQFYEPKNLEVLDPDNVYVGFFASRTFKVTFSEIELTTVDPAVDDPADERPTEYVTPNYQVLSAPNANKSRYELQFRANADGTLVVKDEAGNVLATRSVTAKKNLSIYTTLKAGDNKYTLTFTPVAGYQPDGLPYKKLSDYSAKTQEFIVSYNVLGDGGNDIYVTTTGSSSGNGTKDNPVDIYTAVKYVKAGQTIHLAEGEYKLEQPVVIARGVDGTAAKPITMKTDSGRAKFDFQQKCAGFTFAGSYWNVSDIDCTGSADGQKGILLCGSRCTFENIHTYKNGNTGLQLSRYASTDSRSQWPSYNLIKNCTSYANADSGFEDADGFAAKLTVGDGNVFDGCISYNNADDGWDLFAKPETGHIGAVTIQNCMAFNNGYGLDGTSEGNGNGFKMGGSSITGYHHLINSIAFGNKAKGIDSNSCPDIQVTNCTSFNNGGYNVAFYTNDARNTDYSADGVISFRTDGGTDDQFKLLGSQNKDKVYSNSNFYVIGGKTQNYDGTNEKAIELAAASFKNLTVPAKDSYQTDPISVAKNFRATDGRINVGDLLQLTDEAKETLTKAGIDTTKLGAKLDGTQKVYNSSADITGREAGKDTGLTYNGKSVPGTSSGSSSASSSTVQPTTTTKVDTTATSVKVPDNATAETKAAAQAISESTAKKDHPIVSGSNWTSSLNATAASDSVKNNADVKSFIAAHPGQAVTITVVPTVEVEVKAADAKALTYDITPKFNILLQAGSDQKLLEQREKVPVTGTVTMQVPIPASYAGDGVTLYIIHKLDNGAKKYYSGKIADGILTFLNPDGFSEFVITKDKPADFVDSSAQTVYRLYNPSTGEHLYTLDAHEVKVITTTQGWVDETKGSAPMTALSKDTEGGVPVYRFYCPSLGHHFYTTNVYEKDVLKNNKDWNFEGVAFKSAPTGTGTAVYRLNKNGVAIHHYTNQKHEVDVLTEKKEWLDEGVAWYSFTL